MLVTYIDRVSSFLFYNEKAEERFEDGLTELCSFLWEVSEFNYKRRQINHNRRSLVFNSEESKRLKISLGTDIANKSRHLLF